MTVPLVQLLGKEVTDPEAAAFLFGFPERPDYFDESCPDGAYHLCLPQHGWEVLVRNGQVVSLFLFSGEEDERAGLEQGCAKFEGELPGGIEFQDPRNRVREKLGPPAYARSHARPVDGYQLVGCELYVYYLPDFRAISYLLLTVPPKRQRAGLRSGEVPTAENGSPETCPQCGSHHVAEILYGLPDLDQVLPEVDAGRVVMSGCCVFDDSPRYRCLDCNNSWGIVQKDQ